MSLRDALWTYHVLGQDEAVRGTEYAAAIAAARPHTGISGISAIACTQPTGTPEGCGVSGTGRQAGPRQQ